jgi:hypothetical protein
MRVSRRGPETCPPVHIEPTSRAAILMID